MVRLHHLFIMVKLRNIVDFGILLIGAEINRPCLTELFTLYKSEAADILDGSFYFLNG